jgi:hypothetical protein
MVLLFWLGLILVLAHAWWLYQCRRLAPTPPCPGTIFEHQLDNYFQNVIPFDRDETCHNTLPEFYKEMFEDTTPYVGSRRYGDNPPDVFYL